MISKVVPDKLVLNAKKIVAPIKNNNKDHEFVTWPVEAKVNGLDVLIELCSG